jgi:hypothetical protein
MAVDMKLLSLRTRGVSTSAAWPTSPNKKVSPCLPASSTSGASSPDKALPGIGQGPSLKWEGSKKAPPPCWGGKCAKEGSSPRQGEGKCMREDSSPCREERVNKKARDRSRKSRTPCVWRVYPVGRSSVPSREHAWRMWRGNPLPWASIQHHNCNRRGK